MVVACDTFDFPRGQAFCFLEDKGKEKLRKKMELETKKDFITPLRGWDEFVDT